MTTHRCPAPTTADRESVNGFRGFGELTFEEYCARVRDERAAIADPFDRIVFDNQWINGVPLGLLALAAEGDDR